MKTMLFGTRHLGMSDTCSNAAYIRPRQQNAISNRDSQVSLMSKRENNYSAKLIIAMLLMFLGASFSPLVSANSNENNEQNEEEINLINEPYVVGDLNYFIPEIDGRQYLFSEESPVYSASRWIGL